MKIRSGLAALAVTTTVIASACAEDALNALLGKWEGEVQTESGSYPRTLIVKSIEERDGATVLQAKYGGVGGAYGQTEQGLAPVKILVEVFAGRVTLRFFTPDYVAVALTLYKDGRHLLGSIQARGASGFHSSRAENP